MRERPLAAFDSQTPAEGITNHWYDSSESSEQSFIALIIFRAIVLLSFVSLQTIYFEQGRKIF